MEFFFIIWVVYVFCTRVLIDGTFAIRGKTPPRYELKRAALALKTPPTGDVVAKDRYRFSDLLDDVGDYAFSAAGMHLGKAKLRLSEDWQKAVAEAEKRLAGNLGQPTTPATPTPPSGTPVPPKPAPAGGPAATTPPGESTATPPPPTPPPQPQQAGEGPEPAAQPPPGQPSGAKPGAKPNPGGPKSGTSSTTPPPLSAEEIVDLVVGQPIDSPLVTQYPINPITGKPWDLTQVEGVWHVVRPGPKTVQATVVRTCIHRDASGPCPNDPESGKEHCAAHAPPTPAQCDRTVNCAACVLHKGKKTCLSDLPPDPATQPKQPLAIEPPMAKVIAFPAPLGVPTMTAPAVSTTAINSEASSLRSAQTYAFEQAEGLRTIWQLVANDAPQWEAHAQSTSTGAGRVESVLSVLSSKRVGGKAPGHLAQGRQHMQTAAAFAQEAADLMARARIAFGMAAEQFENAYTELLEQNRIREAHTTVDGGADDRDWTLGG